ncbi:Ppx/GppA phosphatase family protein [Herbidospora sp. NBRC 101105]|uniref:Ppx/GppA phosphatase family protein n=1 Tax=Herbidospora sp. NBRC 101105 TaxID=3032195 RepID=UPI0024A237E8|nr:Ppx/GppA phosphatase family protein [Herbidospora sp. NBRC 101105]GLX98829.1 hydrolase [Herbidospora sp. NBRC 101105]
MTRVAAIDCGTNSVRLLIADVEGDTLTDVTRRMEIVRLGQGVDKTGMLAPEALERTFAAMRGYAAEILDEGAVKTRVVATSATRDAGNRDVFVDGVRAIFGVEPEVVTGAAEAALSFNGAVRGISDPPGPYLVVDIGGGSTEFVVGSSEVKGAVSMDIGCVRLTERHDGDFAAMRADVDAALAVVADTVPVRDARTLVGLAGSVTTVAGIALDLPFYDSEKIHHSRISAADVHEVTDRLLRMTREERAAIPVMHPGRVDVICAGALILDGIVRDFGFTEVVVSEHDILDGIAWSLT